MRISMRKRKCEIVMSRLDEPCDSTLDPLSPLAINGKVVWNSTELEESSNRVSL